MYSNSKNLSIKFKAKAEYHFSDYRENNLEIESSGGTFMSVSPIVYYKPVNSIGIIASIDIPVYRYVNGYQLANYYAFRIGLVKKIS